MSSEPDVIESNSFSIVCPCCSTILVVCRSALPAPQHHSDPQRDETGWWFSCSQCNYRWWYRSDFIEESSNSHEKIETIQTLKKLLNEFSDDSADAFSFSSSVPFSHPVDQLISDAVKDLAPTQKTEKSKQLYASVSENSRQNPPSASAPEIDETIIENIKTQILSEVKTELDSYQKSIQQQANIQNPLFDPKSVPSHIRKIGSAFFPQKKTHTKHPSPQNHPAPKTKYSYKRVLPSNFSVQNIHPEKINHPSSQAKEPPLAKPAAPSKKKSPPFSKIFSSLKGVHFSSPFHPSAKAASLSSSSAPALVETPRLPDASPENKAAASQPQTPPDPQIQPDIQQNAPRSPDISSETETKAVSQPQTPPDPQIQHDTPRSPTSNIKVPDKNTVITYSNFKANISDTSFRKYPLFSLIDDKPVHFIKKEINIQTYSTYPKQIVQSPKKVFTSSLSENEFKPKNAFVAASSPQTQLMEPQARKAPTLNPSPLNDYDGDTIKELYEQPLEQEPPLEADPIATPEIPQKKSLFSRWRARRSSVSAPTEAIDSSDSSIEPLVEESVTSEPALDEPIREEPAIAEVHEQPLQREPPLEADPIATPEIPAKKSMFSWFRVRKHKAAIQFEEDSSLEPANLEPAVKALEAPEPVVEESIPSEPAIAETHEEPSQSPLDADPVETPEIPIKKSLFSWWRTRKRQVAIQFEEDSSLKPANLEPAVEALEAPEPAVEESIPSEPAIAETHEEPSQPPLEADPIETPEIPIKKSKFSWFRARKHKAAIQFEEDSSLEPANLEPAVKALEAPDPAVEESIPSEPAIAETHEEPSQPPLEADPIETPEIPVKKSMFSWFRARKHKAAIQFEEDSLLEPANLEPAVEALEAPEPAVEESIPSEPAIAETHEEPSQPPLDADPIETPEIPVKKSLFSWWRVRKHKAAIQFEEDSSLEPANSESAMEELEAPEPAVEESIPSEPSVAAIPEELQQTSLEADPIETPEIPVKKSLFSWWRARKRQVAIQFEEDSSLKPANLEPAVEALEAPEPVVEESIPSEPAIAETHEEPSQSPLEADPIETPEIPIKKSKFSWFRARKHKAAIQFEEDSSLEPANSESAMEALEAPEPANSPAVEESITSEPAAETPAAPDPAMIEAVHAQLSQQEPPLNTDPIPMPKISAKKQRVFTFSLDPFLQKKSPFQAHPAKSMDASTLQLQSTSKQPSKQVANLPHQAHTVSAPALPKPSPFKSVQFHFSSAIFLKKKRKPKVSIELRANHLSSVLDPLPQFSESISLSNQTSKRIKVALRSNIESKLTKNIKPYIAIKEESHHPIVIPFEHEETIVLPPLIPMLHPKKPELRAQNFSHHSLKIIDCPKIPASEPRVADSSRALRIILFMSSLSFITTGSIFITNQYKETGLELWKRNVFYAHSHSLSTPLLLKEATYSILEGTPTNKLLIVGEVTNPNDHSAKMCSISIKVYAQNNRSKPLYAWNYFHFTTHILPKEHILFRTEKEVHIPLDADLHIEVELVP